MSEQVLPVAAFNEGLVFELPSFKNQPAIALESTKLKEAERRAHETRIVSRMTYSDLAYCFSSAYNECKTNLTAIGYLINKTESEIHKAEAIALMDKYQEYIKDKPAKFDTAHMRDSFVTLDEDCNIAKERLDSLKMVESFLDGRAKFVENVLRYMKTTVETEIKSGVSSTYGR